MYITRIAIVVACAAALLTTDAGARKPARSADGSGFPPEMGAGPPHEEMMMRGTGRHGVMAPVTEEEEALVMAFLEQVAPERAQRLREIKETSPRWYNMAIRRALAAEARLSSMASADSAAYRRHRMMFRLEAESEDLAMQYRQADTDAEREQIRTRLIATLSELFDLREAEKAMEVERLERRLEFLRQKVEERMANKDDIVARRAASMLGERDEMEW